MKATLKLAAIREQQRAEKLADAANRARGPRAAALAKSSRAAECEARRLLAEYDAAER